MSLAPLIKIDALDVNTVNISKMDGFDKVTVAVTLEAAVISKLRNKYPDEDLNDEIPFILEQKTLEPISMLKYEGKTKIRSDVLEKLKKISDLMENQTVYPNLKLQHLTKIINKILEISSLTTSNRRTYDKYVKAVNDCIYSYSRKRLSLYESTDCSCFVQVVNEKLSERYS